MPPPLHRCPADLLARDLAGTTVLITGGCGGVGLAAAKQLAEQKATVVITGHDAAKGEAAAAAIGATYLHLDNADTASVEAGAAKFLEAHDALHVLMCNAAVMKPGAPDSKAANKRVGEGGWEVQMATNYLGHALLIERLLPLLKKTGGARIVNVSSCAATWMPMAQPDMADVDLDDPHWKTRPYDDANAYASTKLSQVLYTRELAAQLKEEKSDVKVVALHPGWVNSGLARHEPFVMRMIQSFIGPFLGLINNADGAQVPLFCCLGEIESGLFYSQFGMYGDKQMQPGGLPCVFINPNATDEKQKMLWAWTRTELGL